MKIVYCAESLVPSGGTERVTTTKLNWLAARPDIDVWVVTPREERPPFFPLDPHVKRVMIDCSPSDRRCYHRQLEKILSDIRPDATVAVSGIATSLLPSLRDGSRKILEFHYTKNFLVNFVRGIEHIRFRSLHLLKMRWMQWQLARTARRYDRFVGLTQKDVDLWGNPRNMTFVHNPLSFRSAEKSDCLSHRIIGVGSWTPAKGFDQLLEAFGPLASRFPDWTVELYGAGQDEKRLRAIIAKYGIEGQVSLNAPVPDIERRLRECSIYAFPSRSDGFGLVITEAMECGLPTVAMDCPCGPCEIVTERTGFVVPEQDIAAFSAALERLMADETLRVSMGKAAAEEVSRFYPDAIMPRWLKIFDRRLGD